MKLKVLSLDGGGVRGVLQARLLTNIEKYLNSIHGDKKTIGQRFDLLVGTSTGGIIALALSIGRSSEEVLRFYEKHIPKIFSNKNRSNGVFIPKYTSRVLHDALVEFFGEKTLDDATTNVCITSVSLQDAKPRLHKSSYLSRNSERLGESLVDIALATSAAPTYFPSHSTKYSSNLIDGGICANNPSMIAIVEAMQILNEKNSISNISALEDIALLSIGTGNQNSLPYNHLNLVNAGKQQWMLTKKNTNINFINIFNPLNNTSPILEMLMSSQAQLAHHQSSFLIGDGYHRISPELQFPMALDDFELIDELKNLSSMSKSTENYLNINF